MVGAVLHELYGLENVTLWEYLKDFEKKKQEIVGQDVLKYLHRICMG
jgi:hypothetical protein